MKTNHSLVRCFGLVLITVMFPVSTSFALISGTVTDTTGSPVSGALVTFTDESNPENEFRGYTDNNGTYDISISPTLVDEDMPRGFRLHQNYPNPFNPSTTIPYSIDKSGYVNLSVYNIMGQKVRTLIDDHQPAGSHVVIWNGFDGDGNNAGAGVYIYQLKRINHSESRKMLLIDGGIVRAADGVFVAKGVAGTENTTYHVTIHGSNIVVFEQGGITLDEDKALDFIVKLLPGGLNLVTIPGGTFQMGNEFVGRWGEIPVHTVTLDGFEMSTTEITYARYAAYLNEALASEDINEPSGGIVTGKTGEYSGQNYINLSGYNPVDAQYCWIGYDNGAFSVEPGYENRPAGFVSWYGAKAFALYYGLDLPTEAEWEYAARGGKQYKYGTDDGTIDSTKANYNQNIGHPVDVGSYPPNPFGLYDMSGNVTEWCNDWFGVYSSESVTNPTGTQLYVSDDRTGRGGSWFYETCSSYGRFYSKPYFMHDSVGFRVARRPGGVTY